MELGRVDPPTKSWITDNEVPDPENLPELASYMVLVRPIKVENKVGSIELPDTFRDDVQFLTNVGRVVKLGPTAFIDPDAKGSNPYGKFAYKFADVDDYVVWGKHSGVKIKIRGISYVLLNDDQLLMKVEDPKDINPMDSLMGTAQYRS
jgi:co-chaperonin GroES (HSP10)